jgi:hypothetical protein
MHTRLAGLKKKYADILYIKIIFPEDSGLSYNEAWVLPASCIKNTIITTSSDIAHISSTMKSAWL